MLVVVVVAAIRVIVVGGVGGVGDMALLPSALKSSPVWFFALLGKKLGLNQSYII